MHRGVEVQLHAFLTPALIGDGWFASHPGRFNPKEGILVPLDGELGGWSGCCGGGRNSALPGIEPRSSSP
jgi:hypothetical protein